MARMLVIYKKPQDTAAFDKHYVEIYVPLAKKLPGIWKYEVSRGPIAALAGGDAYLVAILTFDSPLRSRAPSPATLAKPAPPTACVSRPIRRIPDFAVRRPRGLSERWTPISSA